MMNIIDEIIRLWDILSSCDSFVDNWWFYACSRVIWAKSGGAKNLRLKFDPRIIASEHGVAFLYFRNENSLIMNSWSTSWRYVVTFCDCAVTNFSPNIMDWKKMKCSCLMTIKFLCNIDEGEKENSDGGRKKEKIFNLLN